MIMGRVRLKSNRAAFSISTAREGGARVSEVAATKDKDFSVEVERLRNWSFVIFGVGSLVELEMISLGFVVVESDGAGVTSVLEEAMIMLAMPAYCLMELLLLQGSVFVCVILFEDVLGGMGGDFAKGYLILCHTN